ncbi:MAG: excisionase family DNA-binding protein [Afipia sp.]|nr:excisionase family DNA-binding protein [Afipia sp.]
MAHKEQVGEQLLDTIDGTARRLGVGRSSVYQLIKDKQLEAVKIGRSVRIPIDSTIALVQRLRGAA